MFVKLLERIFGLTSLDSVCAGAAEAVTEEQTMFKTLVDALELRLDVTDADKDRIPTEGPIIVVANHPMGGIDGILLGTLLHSIRKDWRVLSHVWFRRYPGLAKQMIFVDPRHETQDRKSNSRAIKDAVRWVRRGGSLAMFPAGQVATRPQTPDLPALQSRLISLASFSRARWTASLAASAVGRLRVLAISP